ncbi:MAG TPA: PAS domain-containing protein [Aquella sp.]|nr:PAS domain-containing protein [Aquella sp.]
MKPKINFESIIKVSSGYIYWKDLNSVYLGCNQNFATLAGLATPEDVVGKTDRDFFWGVNEANQFIADDKHVIKTKKTLVSEYKLVLKSAEVDNHIVVKTEKSPLYDNDGKIVGILVIGVDITSEKNTEQLRSENQAQLATIKAHEDFKKCLDEIQQIIQSYKINILNNRLGVKSEVDNSKQNIIISKRECEILYYLALNKSPKEIASIFAILDQKSIAAATIQSIIDKQLYVKFNVFNISQLIEKANMLRLIPFLPDS